MTQRARESEEPLIARDATYYRAPDALRGRVRTAVMGQSEAHRTRSSWRVLSWGFALAAASVLSWNLALMQRGAAGQDFVERDVLSAHVRSIMPTGKLFDVPSGDRHEVKPWFAGKLDYSPPVPDLAARGFALVGGRLDYVDGRTVAAVTYRYRLHIVNVFEWPATDPKSAAPQVMTRQGYNIVHWSRDGMERWAISDLAAAELARIADPG